MLRLAAQALFIAAAATAYRSQHRFRLPPNHALGWMALIRVNSTTAGVHPAIVKLNRELAQMVIVIPKRVATAKAQMTAPTATLANPDNANLATFIVKQVRPKYRVPANRIV